MLLYTFYSLIYLILCADYMYNSFIQSFERLAALASGSRLGAGWTAVTPEENPSFCMCVCSRRPRLRRRRRPASIYASFFPFAITALCCCCLLGSFPFPPVLLSSTAPKSPFTLSRTAWHTYIYCDDNEAIGPYLWRTGK